MKTKKQNMSGDKMARGNSLVVKTKADKIAMEEAQAKNNYYTLTQDEYSTLTEAFFRVESTVRIVGQNCFDHALGRSEEAKLLADVSNILRMSEDNLKTMGQLLGK